MRSQYAHFRGLEIALLAQPIDPPRGSSSSRGRVVRVVGSVGWVLFRGVCGVYPPDLPSISCPTSGWNVHRGSDFHISINIFIFGCK